MTELERIARAAVVEGGALIRSTWREHKVVHYKGAVDLVTETDKQVEDLIVARLQAAFPSHRVIAEEAAGSGSVARPATDEEVWYVDPLDGTTNFAHGYPHFAISLAFARGTETQLAIVHDPVRDETFTAERGSGARLNGERIHVSSTATIGEALLATGFPYDRREHLAFYLGFFGDFVGAAQGVRRNGSAALDLCYVACGRIDAFWEWKLKPWDTAAGALIVREAGGRVTDFRSAAFDLHGDQTLASNGPLHDGMARILTSRLESRAPA